ncbi:MAG: S-methyl-5-thioribose-1-phosphate isomerase, partial [Burkholderiales bacterium]
MIDYSVETLRWRDARLEMIDQRVLPARFEYLAFDSAQSVAQGIRDMVVRGAPAIGCAAAFGIALEAQRLKNEAPDTFWSGLEQGAVLLGASRPTAVNLFWALNRMRGMWQGVKDQTHAVVAEKLLDEALDILAEDIRTNRAMGELGAVLLPDNVCVLTHCNAGALATAGHGTALGVIRSAVEAGKRVSVIASETRPFLQGARLTAWEMVQERIPVT